MKKWAVAGMVFFAMVVGGCEDKAPRKSPPTDSGEKSADVEPAKGSKPKEPAGSGAKKMVVGFSQCTFEDPWRINMNNEIKEAAKEHPSIKLLVANGENRNAKQIADVENFIVRGVDALIISPREAAPLTAAVAKAYDRGIPVIVLDRRVLGDKYTAFIGASNLDIGKAAGEYIVKMLSGKGKVVEIEGILGATATQERHQGFRDAIEGHPDIEVVYDQPGDYKRSPAKRIMDNALQSIDKIDVVYAHNDEMAIGAFLAAKAVGREKEMIFVGIDGQGEAVRMIRDGLIDATFIYPNGAKEAVEAVAKVLAGGTVAKESKLKTTMITKEEHPEYKGF